MVNRTQLAKLFDERNPWNDGKFHVGLVKDDLLTFMDMCRQVIEAPEPHFSPTVIEWAKEWRKSILEIYGAFDAPQT